MNDRRCFALLAGLLAAGCGAPPAERPAAAVTDYPSLLTLFAEWRVFQAPPLVEGAPDYSRATMAEQHRGLADWRARLAAVDTAGWSVSEQVDYRLVWAEMNGLDFDHRVLRPWERNPAFYVTVFWDQSDQPAREGPFAHGALELWRQRFPLDSAGALVVAEGLRPIQPLLAQARTNLTGNARDLWVWGAHALRRQVAALAELETKVAGRSDLAALAASSREATEGLIAWIEAEAPGKTGPSGVGVDNYTWYLQHVALLPLTWHDEVALVERELGRSRAYLALAEHHNRPLPAQQPIASEAEFNARFPAAVRQYIDFLRRHDVMTIRDWHEPALLERIGRYRPGPREFFGEVDYRDPTAMRTHGFHWFDLARLANEPHPSPIRRAPLLYNMFITRTEGLATGWEEMMLEAGLFEGRPRSRELIHMLVAQRAARALGDLMMHANRFTIDEAIAFASDNTPRGWLRRDGGLVGFEQHLYLQQPAYGTSYLIGKMEIEKLLADRARQLGADFSLRRFMDELEAAGLIPISMVRWEMTGVSPAPPAPPSGPE